MTVPREAREQPAPKKPCPKKREDYKCEYCGGICEGEIELQIFHRGCRLKAAFPDCYEVKGGLLKFDVAKMTAKLERAGDPPKGEAGK